MHNIFLVFDYDGCIAASDDIAHKLFKARQHLTPISTFVLNLNKSFLVPKGFFALANVCAHKRILLPKISSQNWRTKFL